MIHRNQPQLVDVIHLFHRLHEAQAELAIHGRNLRAVHLNPFAGVRNIAPRRREPVTHHAGANHIGH